MVIFSENRSV